MDASPPSGTPAPLSASPAADSPQAPAKPSPLEHLRRHLAAGRQRTSLKSLHPRDDMLWVVQDAGYYAIEVRRGVVRYRFTDDAFRQFAGLFDIPEPLVHRLAAMPKSEDTRLLNLCLFHYGARPDGHLQLQVHEDRITAVYSSAFTSLDTESLAELLAAQEAAGTLRLRRYDLAPQSVWLEIEHLGIPPIDLSPAMSRTDHKADWWRAGAILMNQEDAGRAVTVVPALLRDWGGLALPIAPSRDDVRKRRHAQDSPAVLNAQILEDLAATRQTPYAEGAERLGRLHPRFIATSALYDAVDGMGLPQAAQSLRDAIVRNVQLGRPTLFRLTTAALKEIRATEEFARRLTLLTAAGRFVWTKGQPTPRRAPGS